MFVLRGISAAFRIEEELLCKTQSCGESVVLGGYVFYISINSTYLVFEPRLSSASPKGTPCGKDETG